MLVKDRFELERNKVRRQFDIVIGQDAFYITDELIENQGIRAVLELMLMRFRETCIEEGVVSFEG